MIGTRFILILWLFGEPAITIPMIDEAACSATARAAENVERAWCVNTVTGQVTVYFDEVATESLQ